MTGKRPSHLKIAPEVMVDFDNIQKAYAHVNIPELHELLETIMNGYPYPPSLLKDTSQEWSLYFQGVSVYEAGTNFLGTFVRMQKIQFSFRLQNQLYTAVKQGYRSLSKKIRLLRFDEFF